MALYLVKNRDNFTFTFTNWSINNGAIFDGPNKRLY
jgi:hypothetical protein